MGSDVSVFNEDQAYGPAMAACSEMQRAFIEAYFEHPNYSGGQLAEIAGFSSGNINKSSQLRVTGHRLMHNEKVIAAINEETSKRLRGAGYIGVVGIVKVALNESHKDHLKACAMLADRTGFHALSEHKVTVDDKRPQTKKELIDATKTVLAELGMSVEEANAFIKKSTGEDAVDAEFSVVEDEEEIHVEDL